MRQLMPEKLQPMSPEWIPLLFVAAVIVVLLLMLRPRDHSQRLTICRILVIEAIYLGMAYLLLDVLEHPPAEAFLGSIIEAIAGAIPTRYYRRLASALGNSKQANNHQ